MDDFWTIWKMLGLAVVAVELVFLVAVFVFAAKGDKEIVGYFIAAMFVGLACIPVLAAFDISRLAH